MEIVLILTQIIWVLFLAFLLRELKKFLREVLYLMKAKDVYEAKAVLEEKKEEEPHVEEIPLEEMEPEKAVELLQKELKK